MNETDKNIIEQTKKWINKVVIGCNFCPFAAKEVKRNSIHYQVNRSGEAATLLISLSAEVERLDNFPEVETILIILPGNFPDFYDYLDLVALCENFLKEQKKEGIYQIASFHPDYLFEGTSNDDPANYTNRSLYPMIQILRESSITEAVTNFPGPEKIPQRNIDFARQKGLLFMQELRESCKLF
jgi:uncharacterized protein